MDGNSGVDGRACCLYVEMPFVGQQSSDPNLAPSFLKDRPADVRPQYGFPPPADDITVLSEYYEKAAPS